MTGNKTRTPVPGPAYRLLDGFIGKWHTTGKMKVGGGEPDLCIEGTDTYEWLPGGFFIMHKVDVVIGDERKQATEIIGFEPTTKTYTMHAFDNRGEVSQMYATEDQGVWTFASDSMRFVGAFSPDRNTMSGTWEYSHHGAWEFLMEIRLTRPQ